MLIFFPDIQFLFYYIGRQQTILLSIYILFVYVWFNHLPLVCVLNMRFSNPAILLNALVIDQSLPGPHLLLILSLF